MTRVGPGPRDGEAEAERGGTERCSVVGPRDLECGVENEGVVGGISWPSRVTQVCSALGQTRVTYCAVWT